MACSICGKLNVARDPCEHQASFEPSRDARPPRRYYDTAETMDALVWRLCEYRNDHCDRCPASADIEGHGVCKAGCRALAEEMAALVMASCDSDGSQKGEDALAASSETTARAEGIAK